MHSFFLAIAPFAIAEDSQQCSSGDVYSSCFGDHNNAMPRLPIRDAGRKVDYRTDLSSLEALG